MADTLEIIRGLAQAASNAHDGAMDDKGEPVNVGLQRDEEIPITDRRVVDGFTVKFAGNMLFLKYQTEILIKDVHRKDFEGECAGYLKTILNFLKKEYKSVTGKTVALTKDGEQEVLVQNVSRVRTLVTATQAYKIGGIDAEPEEDDLQTKLDDAVKKFMATNKKQYPNTEKPKNYTAKNPS